MRGEDFYELLGELYSLRENVANASILIDSAALTGGAHIALHEFKNKLESFDELLTEQITELLSQMLEYER